MFKKCYNSNGVLDSIYTEKNGINTPLLFNPLNKTFDESDSLTIALRKYEAKNGKLDLSDREPEKTTEPRKYLIYNYIDANDPYASPGSIITSKSLDTFLAQKPKIFYGERVETLYFDPISKVSVIQFNFKYFRNKEGFLLSTETSISFYLEDGSIAEEKKVYLIPVTSQIEQVEELKRRRSNIIAEVQSLAVDFDLVNEMNEIYDTQSANISRYLETGSPLFKKFLESDKTRTWLKAPATEPGKTIKDILISYFSIGALVKPNITNVQQR